MWACHNEREEDQRGSPRESRVTVSPCPRPVNKGSRPMRQVQTMLPRWLGGRPNQRILPFWPIAIVPGCGQYVKPWGFAPVSMVETTSPVAVSMTETDP